MENRLTSILFLLLITICLLFVSLSILPFIKYIPKEEPKFYCGNTGYCIPQPSVPAELNTQYKAGEALFKGNCKACHTLNKRLVRPGLANIEERREKEWLVKAIHNFPQLHKENDPLAVALVEEHGGQMMSSFESLELYQIEAILVYLKYQSH